MERGQKQQQLPEKATLSAATPHALSKRSLSPPTAQTTPMGREGRGVVACLRPSVRMGRWMSARALDSENSPRGSSFAPPPLGGRKPVEAQLRWGRD